MKRKNVMAKWREFNPESNKSIKSDFQDVPSPHCNKILEYLNNGNITLVSTDKGIDVLTGEKIVSSYCILTDGEFTWGNTLAHYVLHYNLKLPDEFENKILNREMAGM